MRWVWFFLSIVTLLIAWTGPLPELSEKAFFGHMIMHMLNVAIAAFHSSIQSNVLLVYWTGVIII